MKLKSILALTCMSCFMLSAETIHYVSNKNNNILRFVTSDMA